MVTFRFLIGIEDWRLKNIHGLNLLMLGIFDDDDDYYGIEGLVLEMIHRSAGNLTFYCYK